jgi:hypothetical protein
MGLSVSSTLAKWSVMRGTLAAALAASFVSFLSTSAFAAVPLQPGKPAGVRGAQLQEPQPLVVLGLAAVAIGITLAATRDNGNGITGPGGSGGTGPSSSTGTR